MVPFKMIIFNQLNIAYSDNPPNDNPPNYDNPPNDNAPNDNPPKSCKRQSADTTMRRHDNLPKTININIPFLTTVYMSQAIEEIRHFRKCLGNSRNAWSFHNCLGICRK